MEISLISVKDLLYSWITKEAKQDLINWIDKKLILLTDNPQLKDLLVTFSATPKFTGREKLRLTSIECEEARSIRPGWQPTAITTDEAARLLFIISFKHSSKEEYGQIIDELFQVADVRELVALYKSLPVLPYPELFHKRAVEGTRSNIKTVFEAIALHNPYPFEILEEREWNQLILKALQVRSRLGEIYGLDKRTNLQLSVMLSDFVQECEASQQKVPPELWRAVGTYLTPKILAHLSKAIDAADPVQQEVAALTCYYSLSEEAKKLLDTKEEIKQKIIAGELNWEVLSQELYKSTY